MKINTSMHIPTQGHYCSILSHPVDGAYSTGRPHAQQCSGDNWQTLYVR